jgi:drug/metabolite transporter (DMT)-like permease
VLIGGTILFLVARAAGENIQLPTDTGTWSAVLYLAVVGSVFTFLVYFWLLKTWSVTTLSFIAVFTPLVAVVLGFLFREERPTTWSGLGGLLILGGATLALWRDTKTVSRT